MGFKFSTINLEYPDVLASSIFASIFFFLCEFSESFCKYQNGHISYFNCSNIIRACLHEVRLVCKVYQVLE